MSEKEKVEKIEKLEIEMLVKRVEGLLKMYKAITEGKIVGKVEIEKEGSAIKFKLLNPEMLYDPIMAIEFQPSEGIVELYNKITSDEQLKKTIIRELEESIVRLTPFILKQVKKLENCTNDDDD